MENVRHLRYLFPETSSSSRLPSTLAPGHLFGRQTFLAARRRWRRDATRPLPRFLSQGKVATHFPEAFVVSVSVVVSAFGSCPFSVVVVALRVFSRACRDRDDDDDDGGRSGGFPL